MNSSKAWRVITLISNSPYYFILAALALIFSINAAMAAPPLLFPEQLTRIALDPGHGGSDIGAKGPTGQLEKTISLELARQLALRLEARHEVILTRSDDYNLAHRERAAIANQANANIFMGIHTGAAFLHGTNAMTIYYFDKPQSAEDLPNEAVGEGDQYRWDKAQILHKTASLELATALQKSLESMKGSVDCKIQAAPLIVLEGVNMPAILIEVGHITHPAAEKTLSSVQGLQALSKAIARGVEDYLASGSTVSP